MIKDIPDWPTAIQIAKDELYPGLKLKSFQEASKVIGKSLEILLISKNLKYGKGNILNSIEFGIDPKKGIALRMNDKFERLKNGLKGTDLGKEGFIDSFGDLIGYNAIGLMLELGWYELPIKEDNDEQL